MPSGDQHMYTHPRRRMNFTIAGAAARRNTGRPTCATAATSALAVPCQFAPEGRRSGLMNVGEDVERGRLVSFRGLDLVPPFPR